MSKAARTRSTAVSGDSADALADRLRAVIPGKERSERRMFGGVGFMLNGNMVAGTFRGSLLVRVGRDCNAQALTRSGAHPMEMRGRAVPGYIMVDQSELDDAALKEWIDLALTYVRNLPAKPSKSDMQQKKGERK